jgi:hypothetical protein
MERCSQIFKQTHKTKFVWLECYEILKDSPKWDAHQDPISKNGGGGNGGGGGGRRKRDRASSTGKCHKALAEKIDKMLVKHGSTASSSSISSDRLSSVGGTLNQLQNR